MHYNIDYSKRPQETKNIDAIHDIIDYLGQAKYDELSDLMKNVRHPKQFSFYCSMAGIEGFPVSAWYDSFHGEGANAKAWDQLEALEGTAIVEETHDKEVGV